MASNAVPDTEPREPHSSWISLASMLPIWPILHYGQTLHYPGTSLILMFVYLFARGYVYHLVRHPDCNPVRTIPKHFDYFAVVKRMETPGSILLTDLPEDVLLRIMRYLRNTETNRNLFGCPRLEGTIISGNVSLVSLALTCRGLYYIVLSYTCTTRLSYIFGASKKKRNDQRHEILKLLTKSMRKAGYVICKCCEDIYTDDTGVQLPRYGTINARMLAAQDYYDKKGCLDFVSALVSLSEIVHDDRRCKMCQGECECSLAAEERRKRKLKERNR